jgi:hypothetical protein
MEHTRASFDTVLRVVVGAAAIAAPALHSLTDALEWFRGGFSPLQLMLNYAAFVPMPWLLLGLYAVHVPRPGALGLVGALLYGAAFAYFGHTTLFALSEAVPDYEALWQRLGPAYTLHGIVMIAGGALFAWSAWRAAQLPRAGVVAFAAGLAVNLVLGVLPAPDILQTLGTALRNLGLVAMGCAVVRATRPVACRGALQLAAAQSAAKSAR